MGLDEKFSFDDLMAETQRRAPDWNWSANDHNQQIDLKFTTHDQMVLDLSDEEVADWFRDAHKDGWTVEPFSCLVLEILVEKFNLTSALDIGTHFGFISLFLLRLKQLEKIYGVEMNPKAVQVVEQQLAANPGFSPSDRYKMFNVGLSDQIELDQTIWYEGMRLSFQSLHRFTEHKLDILSLKALCDQIGYVPELMKIDIEGWEGRLVDDLNIILDEAKPKVLLELHWDEVVERHGKTRKDIMMAFLSRGYNCARLNWHQKMPRGGFYQEVTIENLDEMLGNKPHAMFALF